MLRVELYLIAFLQGSSLDRARVDEHVLAAVFWSYEAETFSVIEELHCASCHLSLLYFLFAQRARAARFAISFLFSLLTLLLRIFPDAMPALRADSRLSSAFSFWARALPPSRDNWEEREVSLFRFSLDTLWR
jgi:hypothetical protein